MITVGLDLSLTKTGYAIVRDTGEVIASGVIKSKPRGTRPAEELERLLSITHEIVDTIDSHIPDEEPDLIMIEGLAFMARNTTALVQLSGLNYLVRTVLTMLGWPFVIVAPTSLKKFITEKGQSDKGLMMMVVYKDYGFESVDDNECDAYALAVCGQALLGSPINKMTKKRAEVVTLLQSQVELDK